MTKDYFPTMYPANITCSKSTIKTLGKGLKYVLKLTIKTPERRH